MSENKAMLPRLRFPEFRDAGPLEEKRLGELSEIVRGGSPRPIDGFLTADENGLNWLKIGDVDKSSKFVTHTQERVRIEALSKTREVHPGDLILSNSMSFGRPYILKIKSCIHDGWIAITQIDDQADRDYLYYFISSPVSQVFFINNAAGSGVQNLNADIIKSLPVLFPKGKTEQQKIAACLSSLDDLITARGQKLAALERHKKGLMQQLFPAADKNGDQTTPTLRFPEFREAGPWEEKRLGDCLSRHPEYGINAPAVPYSETLPTYLRITDISEDGHFLENKKSSVSKKVNVENYLLDGDIVLARTGASVGKSYKYNKADGDLVFAGFLIRVRPDAKKLNSEFLSQFFTTEEFWRWVDFSSARSGQPGINGNEYASLPIPLPSAPEQQKIAACLTSVDDLIRAEAQKLDTLKAHKKGLMQQLFPNSDLFPEPEAET